MEFIQQEFLGKNQEIYTIKMARKEDAKALLEHSKRVRGETDFLLTYPEELTMTEEEEREMLKTFQDRKSTRLNSSHANISYAVFCLKKKHPGGLHRLLAGPAGRRL